MMKSFVYIDGANLHQGSKQWKQAIDYARFFKRLSDKYKPTQIYMFVGYIKGKEKLYTELSTIGYKLVFKETLKIDGKVKGNCDAELVIQAVSDHYELKTDRGILVTGDGDFGCLIDFYQEKKSKIILLAPNKDFCSYLLKKKNSPIIFLEEVFHKFGQKRPKKKTEKKTSKPKKPKPRTTKGQKKKS